MMRFWGVYLALCVGAFMGLGKSVEAEELWLRDNLAHAQAGDYLVVSANKTQTVLHIYAKTGEVLTIEEIAVPENKKPGQMGWKEWVRQGAPGNTSWVLFDIHLPSGKMMRYYSFTKKSWLEIPDADNFLGKLFHLKFHKIPDSARKRVGPKPISGPEWRPFWQPRLVVEGQPVVGVLFDAWQARWPSDNSELAGKAIEVYLPRDGARYPAYFPYWLQINGVAGKAKIRIIDSGRCLSSPTPPDLWKN